MKWSEEKGAYTIINGYVYLSAQSNVLLIAVKSLSPCFLCRTLTNSVARFDAAQNPDGEIAYCDIELRLNDDPGNVEWFVGILNAIGIAKGSVLSGPEIEIQVGTLEGMAYYSNGTELPDEVYQNCDINYVVENMEQAMESIGSLYSYWQGATYTAFYFYGTSFDEMKSGIEPFIATYNRLQGLSSVLHTCDS